MKIIDPNKIEQRDLPLIFLSSDGLNLISYLIKLRTKSNYNHAMIMVKPGFLVSQDWTLNEVPIEKYLKKKIKMKIWKPCGLKPKEVAHIYNGVKQDLDKNKFKNRYDVLGVLGQLIGIKKFNNKFTYYCSERVIKYFRDLKDFMNLPEHPTPEDLNKVFKKKKNWKVYGYCIRD